MDHRLARELMHAGKDLPPADRNTLEAHLEGCPSCRDYAAFLNQLERELPASLPGVAFSQIELSRAASSISSRTRGGNKRKRSFDGIKLAAWGAAAVLLVLVLSWGIQNLMPQQSLPVGMGDQTGTPFPGEEPAVTPLLSEGPKKTPQPYPEPVSTITPTDVPMSASAQEIALNAADLGEGWTLDAEISDYNTNYKFDRREDGKAVIEILKKHPEPRLHPDLVDSVSWRAFSQREQNYVLGQLVIVFKDAVVADEEIGFPYDCTPPCEHVTDYGESGTREIYENVEIGDESVLARFFALEFDSQNVMNILEFRKGEVVVFLQSLPKMIYEDNWEVGIVSDSVISGERLTELSRIIEARIPSSPMSPEAQAERLQPSLTGELLSLSGWSPDGQWLVYWTPESPDPSATGFIELVFRLGFYNPDSGQTCRYDEVTSTGYARMLDWHPDGRWGFQQDGRFLAALPCEDPAPTDPQGFLTSAVPDLSVSPDGRYQAVTVRTAEGRVQYLETSLIDLETGEAAELLHDGRLYTGLPWRIDLPVLYENFIAGEWLTDRVFLINHSYDQGPLLLSPGEQVVQVSPELFDEPPGYQDAEGYSRRASGSPHPDGENFHLLLRTIGREIDHLFLKLYHSETGVVEELPYRHAWAGGFFQGYLFLDPRETVAGYETNGIWVRPVDPPGSPGTLLASKVRNFQVSPDLDRLVYSDDRDYFILVSFPDGEVLRSGETRGYGSGWIYWSPDRRRIAFSGQAQGSQEVGIFIVEVE